MTGLGAAWVHYRVGISGGQGDTGGLRNAATLHSGPAPASGAPFSGGVRPGALVGDHAERGQVPRQDGGRGGAAGPAAVRGCAALPSPRAGRQPRDWQRREEKEAVGANLHNIYELQGILDHLMDAASEHAET